MPTHKPRIGLSVSDEMYDLIGDVSELLGRSMSGLVVEVLEDRRESLEQIKAAFQREEKQRRKLLDKFGERVGMSLPEIESMIQREKRSQRAA